MRERRDKIQMLLYSTEKWDPNFFNFSYNRFWRENEGSLLWTTEYILHTRSFRARPHAYVHDLPLLFFCWPVCAPCKIVHVCIFCFLFFRYNRDQINFFKIILPCLSQPVQTRTFYVLTSLWVSQNFQLCWETFIDSKLMIDGGNPNIPCGIHFELKSFSCH